MRLPGLTLAVALTLWALPAPAETADRLVRLTATDWPPFTGPGEPGDSMFTDIIRRALATRGYAVEVTIMPWKRAQEVALSDPSYIGVAAVYADDLKTLRGFFASAAVMTSPIGLAERVDRPIHWDSLADLGKYTLGTVLGYRYTPEFDEAAVAGRLTVESAPSDLVNIRRLAAGRVDAAVTDMNTLDYCLEHDPGLRPMRPWVQFDRHTLADKGVYVAFREGATGRALAAELAEGMKALDPASLPTLAH